MMYKKSPLFTFIIATLLVMGLTIEKSFSQSAVAQNNSKNNNQKSINWLDIEEVQEKAQKNPKKVFVDVFTDWCGWCKKMDKETFADPEVVEYVNKHFYAVKMDAEARDSVQFHSRTFTKRQLARAFRVQSFPTIVLMNESLTELTPVPGYRNAEQFKKMLMHYNGDLESKQSTKGKVKTSGE